MAQTINPINSITIETQPSFADSVEKAAYDMPSTQLKTIDIESARSASKAQLITYYQSLQGFLTGTVTAAQYAQALETIKKYVITADDYAKLRDGEITVKDFLKDVTQNELYSSTAGSEGYYVKLGTALQTVIDSINTNLITPLNEKFTTGNFFPNGAITEDFLSGTIKTEIDDFSAGNTVISTKVSGSITASSDEGTAAKTAAASYTKKPSVIILSEVN